MKTTKCRRDCDCSQHARRSIRKGEHIAVYREPVAVLLKYSAATGTRDWDHQFI